MLAFFSSVSFYFIYLLIAFPSCLFIFCLLPFVFPGFTNIFSELEVKVTYYRSRRIDDYDPIAREKEREGEQAAASLIDRKEDHLGYTVAQYGNGAGALAAPGQTVSSRTFTGMPFQGF